eukprot:11860707-Heterocapsa_arctica.AAC.1
MAVRSKRRLEEPRSRAKEEKLRRCQVPRSSSYRSRRSSRSWRQRRSSRERRQPSLPQRLKEGGRPPSLGGAEESRWGHLQPHEPFHLLCQNITRYGPMLKEFIKSHGEYHGYVLGEHHLLQGPVRKRRSPWARW